MIEILFTTFVLVTLAGATIAAGTYAQRRSSLVERAEMRRLVEHLRPISGGSGGRITSGEPDDTWTHLASKTARPAVAEDPTAEDTGTYEIIDRAPDNRYECEDCGARRCWAWRVNGHTTGWGCGNANRPGNSYRNMLTQITRPGGHTAAAIWSAVVTDHTPAPTPTAHVIVRDRVSALWSPLTMRDRVLAAPTYWAGRLGRVVQVGTAASRLGALP